MFSKRKDDEIIKLVEKTPEQPSYNTDASPDAPKETIHQQNGLQNPGQQVQGDNDENLNEENGGYGSYDAILSEIHDDMINKVGLGRYQYCTVVLLGLYFMGDLVEMELAGVILTGAEIDFCMDTSKKGYLGSIVFLGMILGAFLFGSLGDSIGRKLASQLSVSISLMFAVLSAFMPYYGWFLFFRMCCGIGIGGSIPIMLSIAMEISPRQHRGTVATAILFIWYLGAIYGSVLGWSVVPNKGLGFHLSDDFYFGSWRVFILLCAIPFLVVSVGFIFMYESPRYLLSIGDRDGAMEIYKCMYRINHPSKKTGDINSELPDIPPIQMKNQNADAKPRGCIKSCINWFTQSKETYKTMFNQSNRRSTVILGIMWFTVGFAFYGVTIWFPTFLNKLATETYLSNTKHIENEKYSNVSFMKSAYENIVYSNCTFENVTFQDVALKYITFLDSAIMNSTYQNITSVKTYFKNCAIYDTVFNYTDFYSFRFINDSFFKSPFLNTKSGCELDIDVIFDEERRYLENMIGSLAVLPGVLCAGFLANRIGRVKLLIVSQFLSGLSAFFLWAVNYETASVAIMAVFNFFFVVTWIAVDLLSAEIPPTEIRSSSLGFQSCMARIAAVLANVIFGQFFDISKAIPIVLTTVLCLLNCIISLLLPDTTDKRI